MPFSEKYFAQAPSPTPLPCSIEHPENCPVGGGGSSGSGSLPIIGTSSDFMGSVLTAGGINDIGNSPIALIGAVAVLSAAFIGSVRK